MNLHDMIEGKKEWRAHMERVKALPQEYQVVYHEIQKYLFKVGVVDPTGGMGYLSEIVDLFAEGAATGKNVLDLTGKNVAAFCDELIKDAKTYYDLTEELVEREVQKAMNKASHNHS